MNARLRVARSDRRCGPAPRLELAPHAARRHASVLWPAASAVIVGAARILTAPQARVAQVRNSWRGLAHVLTRLRLGVLARAGDSVVGWLVGHWWLTAIVGAVVRHRGRGCSRVAHREARRRSGSRTPCHQRGTDYALDPARPARFRRISTTSRSATPGSNGPRSTAHSRRARRAAGDGGGAERFGEVDVR